MDDGKFVDAACSDAAGNFYFSDLGGGTGIYKVALNGAVSVFNAKATGISGMKVGPDGRLYACQSHQKRVIAIDPSRVIEVLAEGVDCNDLVVDHEGRIHVTETSKSRVLLIEAAGKSRVVAKDISTPNGLALSPDQGILAVSNYDGKAAWAFRVEANGDLRAGMPVFPTKLRRRARVERRRHGVRRVVGGIAERKVACRSSIPTAARSV